MVFVAQKTKAEVGIGAIIPCVFRDIDDITAKP